MERSNDEALHEFAAQMRCPSVLPSQLTFHWLEEPVFRNWQRFLS